MPSRIAYFHKKEYSHDQLKRIVTGAYCVNLRTGQLRYGGTIYRQESEDERWCRRLHLDRALDRLTNNPVIIEFGQLNLDDFGQPGFYQYRRLENFIRKVCMPLFGVEHHDNREPNRNTHFQDSLEQLKEKIFDDELTISELQDQEDYENDSSIIESGSSQLDRFQCCCHSEYEGFTSDFHYGFYLGIATCFIARLVALYWTKYHMQ